jgi:hypothetical protein
MGNNAIYELLSERDVNAKKKKKKNLVLFTSMRITLIAF